MTQLTRSAVAVLAAGALTAPSALTAQSRHQQVEPAGHPLGWVAGEALRSNRRLAEERLQTFRAEDALTEATGRLLPAVGIESRYTEQSGTINLGDFVNPVNSTLNGLTGTASFPTDLDLTLPQRHQSSIRLVQPIFAPAAWAGRNAAGHALDAQRAGTAATARAVAAEAQASLLAVGAAASVRGIWEATLPLVTEAERVSQRLVDTGLATPDAVFRARADRSEVQQELDQARENEAAARRALNQLLARDLDTPFDAPREDAILFEIEMTEEAAIRSALAQREELVGTTAGIAAARSTRSVATAAILPSAAIAVDYGFQGNSVSFGRDNDFWTASLVLSWNVFSGGQNLARRRSAEAEVAQRALRHDETVERVRLDVRQAYRNALVARDAIATAGDRAAAAERSYELIRRRYDEGLATPVELVDARAAFTNAELNRSLTVYRYAIAWVDLERAAALIDLDALEG